MLKSIFASLFAFRPWSMECVICGVPLRGSLLCHSCTPKTISIVGRCSICCSESVISPCLECSVNPLPFKALRYMTTYTGDMARLLNIIKYQPNKRLLGNLLKNLDITGVSSADVIVPLPSSVQSMRQRGFSPPLLIASHLAGRYSLPICEYLLPPIHNIPQASLTTKQRLKNNRLSFEPSLKLSVRGADVLLVDDVLTTGVTTLVAARAILAGGARAVSLFTLARGEGWNITRSVVY